ncbi:hypothetical protein [Colwellia psychrerythraea]|uniref:Nickel transport complex protein, NikM subunit, transmembrane n=1 Tax=Colwellia psychrerythraea TaxID=28229 RepID=A0A099L5D6_COLPS|nr:hypothetical protein [Colwellia psychrerythraea]KGJ97402.1 hypothetical protein GAB14E_0991 [Colwellia psychrerythraea]
MPLFSIKTVIFTTLVTLTSLQINAHEVWLERDDNGPVRVYLGEPGEPEVGSEINKLAGSQVFTDDRKTVATLAQKEDHFEALVDRAGDARLFSDQVWQPWQMDDSTWWKFWKSSEEKLQGGILQARVGRNETSAKLTYELVPVFANGNVFTATFEGQPLRNKSISLLTPSKMHHNFTTNKLGQIEIKSQESGRFILTSVHTVDKQTIHSGKQVDSLMYISTLSYVAP